MTAVNSPVPASVPASYRLPTDPTHDPKRYGNADAKPKPVTPERKILIDAGDTINGERQDQYGAAEDSFGGIANYWRNHLQMKYAIDVPLTNIDVALMMTLFKLAREANSPKRDNRLDGIGYLALTERMVE
jgi:hypothetical protein